MGYEIIYDCMDDDYHTMISHINYFMDVLVSSLNEDLSSVDIDTLDSYKLEWARSIGYLAKEKDDIKKRIIDDTYSSEEWNSITSSPDLFFEVSENLFECKPEYKVNSEYSGLTEFTKCTKQNMLIV